MKELPTNQIYPEENKTRRKPDEIDSYEYLAEHLWDRAHRGGFAEDLEGLKRVLPQLKRFAKLPDLLNYIENGHKRWRNRLGADLIRLYHRRPKLRPATMEFLLLVLWHDLTEIYEQIPEGKRRYGEPFADIYWEVFQVVDEQPRITAGRLIRALRDKFIPVEDLDKRPDPAEAGSGSPE